MLRLDIRHNIPSDKVNSFKGLLQQKRLVEQTLLKKTGDLQTSKKKKEIERCSYCQARGHNINECRKKKRNESIIPTVTEHNNTAEGAQLAPPSVSCYGYKAPGVYCSSCPTRNKGTP